MAEVSAAAFTPADTAPQPDDLTLVRRAQGGDVNAYDELVRRYQRQIYGVIYHMTSHHEDANDLTQEAFVKAWQALKSFKGTPASSPGSIASPSTARSIISSSASSGRADMP